MLEPYHKKGRSMVNFPERGCLLDLPIKSLRIRKVFDKHIFLQYNENILFCGRFPLKDVPWIGRWKHWQKKPCWLWIGPSSRPRKRCGMPRKKPNACAKMPPPRDSSSSRQRKRKRKAGGHPLRGGKGRRRKAQGRHPAGMPRGTGTAAGPGPLPARAGGPGRGTDRAGPSQKEVSAYGCGAHETPGALCPAAG